MSLRFPVKRRTRTVIVATLAIAVVGAVFWGVRRYQRARMARALDHAGATGAAPSRPNLRAALPAWANDPDAEPGAVEGVVKTPEGRPFDGALVALIPDVGGNAFDDRIRAAGTARSAGGGRFRIAGVRPGEYGATATAEGFAGAYRSAIAVLPGETRGDVELILEAGGAVLSGKISDAGGGPIASAELRVLAGLGAAEKQTRVFQVLADSGGLYRVSLPPAQYMVVADADGYAPSSRLVDTRVTRTADFALQPAARLAGHVVKREDRSAVADATVLVEDDQVWWRAARETKSNAEGYFEVRDLDAGVYRVSAHKGRLVGNGARAVNVTLGSRTTEITLEIAAGAAVSGTVREAGPTGAPVAGARLRLGGSVLGVGGRVRASSGADGTYRIEGVLPGRYVLAAETRRHAGAMRDIAVQAGKNLDGIDLVLEPEAVVVGKVIGQDEVGVAGATVTARVTEGAASARFGSWVTDRTNKDGGFRLGALASGQLHITAEAADQGHATMGPEPIKAGEQKTVTLKLQPGGSVSGTVSWDEGGPAAGVSVIGLVTEAGTMAQTKTGPDGAFRVGPLPAGAATVIASRQEGYAAFMQIDPRGDRRNMKMLTLAANEHKRGVELVVPKGGHRLAGVAVGPDGKPLEGASVGAVPAQDMLGGFRSAMASMMGEQKVVTGADGRFVIEDLNKGPYKVWGRHPSYPDAEVHNVPTGATNVRIEFKREAVLTGVVVDGKGAPVGDFSVGAVAAEVPGAQAGDEQKAARMMNGMAAMFGGGRQSVHDPNGAFELRGLAAGAYDILVSTPDARVGKLPAVRVAAGERKEGLRIVVQQGTLLRGKVAELGNGKPVSGAPVVFMDAEQPTFKTTGADGAFQIEGLTGGRRVELAIGGPMTGFIPDVFKVTLPAGKTEVDAGTLKVIRGTARMDRTAPGPGLRTEMNDEGRIVVRRVVAKSSAEQAGLKAGQTITAIDGHSLEGIGPGGVNHLLGGPAGTEVQVTIGAAASEPARTVTLTRESGSGSGGAAAAVADKK